MRIGEGKGEDSLGGVGAFFSEMSPVYAFGIKTSLRCISGTTCHVCLKSLTFNVLLAPPTHIPRMAGVSYHLSFFASSFASFFVFVFASFFFFGFPPSLGFFFSFFCFF